MKVEILCILCPVSCALLKGPGGSVPAIEYVGKAEFVTASITMKTVFQTYKCDIDHDERKVVH